MRASLDATQTANTDWKSRCRFKRTLNSKSSFLYSSQQETKLADTSPTHWHVNPQTSLLLWHFLWALLAGLHHRASHFFLKGAKVCWLPAAPWLQTTDSCLHLYFSYSLRLLRQHWGCLFHQEVDSTAAKRGRALVFSGVSTLSVYRCYVTLCTAEKWLHPTMFSTPQKQTYSVTSSFFLERR